MNLTTFLTTAKVGRLQLVRKKGNPQELKRNVTIRFSENEITWLQTEAAKNYRTMAQFVRWIIAEYRATQN